MKEFIRCEHIKRDCWDRPVRCANNASALGFCGVHTPEAVATRKAKKQARIDAKIDAFDAQIKARVAKSRKLRLADDLAVALQNVITGWENWSDKGLIEEAIEEAKATLKQYEEIK